MIENFTYTDGGRRADNFHFERKDCTVRALAIASDQPYSWAHGILKSLGRPTGKGFRFSTAATHLALTEHAQPKRGCGRSRVKTAIRKYAKGRFIFRIRGHVFAVVDGVIHDSSEPRTLLNCTVTAVWEWNGLATPPVDTAKVSCDTLPLFTVPAI